MDSANSRQPNALPSFGFLIVVLIENQVPLEEWEHLGVYAAISAPGLLSPRPVIFLRLVRDSEFIQFVCIGLLGIDIVKILVAARPVKLKPPQGLKILGVLRNQGFEKKTVAQACRELRVDHQLVAVPVRRQINEQRWFG